MGKRHRFSDRMYRDGILDLFRKLKDKINEYKRVLASLPAGKKVLLYLMKIMKLMGLWLAGGGTVNAVIIAKQIRDTWKVAKATWETALNMVEANVAVGVKLNTKPATFAERLFGHRSPFEIDEKTGRPVMRPVPVPEEGAIDKKTMFTAWERFKRATPMNLAKLFLNREENRPTVMATAISIIGGLIMTITSIMIESKVVNDQKKKLGMA